VPELKILALFVLNALHFGSHLVPEHTSSVVQLAKHENRAGFVGLDARVLEAWWPGAFFGYTEASTHVDAVGAQSKACCQLLAITNSAGSEERFGQLLGSLGKQDNATDICARQKKRGKLELARVVFILFLVFPRRQGSRGPFL